GRSPQLSAAYPPGWVAAGPALFLSDSVGGRVLQPLEDPLDIRLSEVVTCSTICSNAVDLPWAAGVALTASPSFAMDKVIVARSDTGRIAVSSDGGASYHNAAMPAGIRASDLVIANPNRRP